MSRGLFTLTSGMITQQRKIDIISNNISNVNTAGYKKEQAVTTNFGEMLISRVNQNGIHQTSDEIGDVSLIRIPLDNNTIHSQGSLDETNGVFDFAVVGSGFFAIRDNDEIYYTRNGSFNLDEEGYLVAENNRRVQGEYGDIYLGTDKVNCTDDGSIYIDGEIIDKIGIFDFNTYDDIEKVSEGIYSSEQQPELLENTVIKNGWIERSNVNMTEEMLEMISSQRALQTNSQAIKMYDQIMDLAVNSIGAKK